jgi:hypothetical protein
VPEVERKGRFRNFEQKLLKQYDFSHSERRQAGRTPVHRQTLCHFLFREGWDSAENRQVKDNRHPPYKPEKPAHTQKQNKTPSKTQP